jgi:hypothetical protein
VIRLRGGIIARSHKAQLLPIPSEKKKSRLGLLTPTSPGENDQQRDRDCVEDPLPTTSMAGAPLAFMIYSPATMLASIAPEHAASRQALSQPRLVDQDMIREKLLAAQQRPASIGIKNGRLGNPPYAR